MDVRHDDRIFKNLPKQHAIAANRDMPNLPVPSGHRRPQTGPAGRETARGIGPSHQQITRS